MIERQAGDMAATPEESRGSVAVRPRATPTLRWFAIAIVLGAAAIAGAVIAAGLVMSAPVRAVIGTPPADLNAESVAMSSASGATLRGWFVAGRPGGGALVLMHGVRSNRLSMLRRARLFGTAGFSVLLFDFQAHGESTRNRISFRRPGALA